LVGVGSVAVLHAIVKPINTTNNTLIIFFIMLFIF